MEWQVDEGTVSTKATVGDERQKHQQTQVLSRPQSDELTAWIGERGST
jgi:hypothetical protein